MATEIYTNAFRQFRNPSDAMMRPHFGSIEAVQGSVPQCMARTVRPNLSVDKPGLLTISWTSTHHTRQAHYVSLGAKCSIMDSLVAE